MLNASSKKTTIAQARPATSSPLGTWGIPAAVILAISGFILSQVVAQIFISVLPSLLGWDTTTANEWLKTPFANFIYVLLAESLIIGVLLAFIRHRKANFWQSIGIRKPNRWDLPLAALGFICYIVIYAVVLMLVSSLLPINTAQEQAVGFAHDVRGLGLVLAFFSLAVLPPLVEETVFRGFLFGTLRRRNVSFWWSAIIVSVLFGSMHLFGGGKGSVVIWIAFLDTLVLSIVLCYLREKTGSIWASIGVHALKNTLVFVNLFIINSR
jgi:membrane protease YdiL (CAAX protease family)